jgi:Mg-chelatase subunit ChlI
MSEPYPFSAIIGQEAMQTALLLSTVDPAIGGVLIRGQKGTAKSTAARALADLLPSIEVVSGCPYHCDPSEKDQLHPECLAKLVAGAGLDKEIIKTPFVDLPLSATEDRLVGTLHLQNTLKTGQRQFEPGLLATAHRGILYVDEVNLLPDHLVDLLLDTAVSGVNLVEREGLQFSHAADFILVGTMNPEEGELRPQFLDRFGLCVSIDGLDDLGQRTEIISRRLDFDRNPVQFVERFAADQSALANQVINARGRLQGVEVPSEILRKAVEIVTTAKTQGHRAELALVRSAKALAALMDRNVVTEAELLEVTPLALAHRFPGASVLNESEVRSRLEGLFDETEKEIFSHLNQTKTSPDEADEPIMENMVFPGSAASGGMLFTYLKKKLKTASSISTNPSI